MLEALSIGHDHIRFGDVDAESDPIVVPNLQPSVPALHDEAGTAISDDDATFFKLHDACETFGGRHRFAVDQHHELPAESFLLLAFRKGWFVLLSAFQVRDFYIGVEEITRKPLERSYLAAAISAQVQDQCLTTL